MSIDFSKVQFTSLTGTLKNQADISGSYHFAGTTLGAGAFTAFTITNVVDNANAISDYQIRYSGLESFYRTVEGLTLTSFPSISAPDYEIGTLTYFSGGSLTLYTYIANQTGGSVVIPAFDLLYRINLYNAPF